MTTQHTKPGSEILVMYLDTPSQVCTCVCKQIMRTKATKEKFAHL